MSRRRPLVSSGEYHRRLCRDQISAAHDKPVNHGGAFLRELWITWVYANAGVIGGCDVRPDTDYYYYEEEFVGGR